MKIVTKRTRHGGVRFKTLEIDEFDTWGMDSTLANIITAMLDTFMHKLHGGPRVDNEDVPEKLRMPPELHKGYNRDGITDVHFFDRWDYVLGEMRYAFAQLSNEDAVIDESNDKRIKNGLRLFAKYYQALWD